MSEYLAAIMIMFIITLNSSLILNKLDDTKEELRELNSKS